VLCLKRSAALTRAKKITMRSFLDRAGTLHQHHLLLY
jgi:hypothetical protein